MKPAVIDADTGRAWTLDELEARAQELKRDLRGRLVAFCMPNSSEWVVRFLAIQKSGGAPVALDPSLSPDAQEQTARKIGAHFLWRDNRLQKISAAPAIRNVWCVKVTSGTTGDPATVRCSGANMKADGRHIIRTMGIRSADCNLAIIPLGHSYGLGNFVMPLLLQGTAVVCAETFVPRQILQLIEEYEVTVFPAVPAILRALAQLEGASKPPSLRLVMSAGATLSAEVAQQFYRRYGIKIHNFYGSSETGGICYDRTGHATLSGRSVGKPLQSVTVRIRRDGRVAVSSRAGKATLPDLGEWNRYGELRLLGRAGQVANIGGKKVAPAEIEKVLRELRGVSDAWVTVLKGPHGDDYLAAVIESARSIAEIERRLLNTLPTWKCPKACVVRAHLPRTARGKLDAARIKQLLDAERAA